MQNKKKSHEELQKNIPDLKDIPEHGYLYHDGYVYYSFRKPGARDTAGWVSGGEVFKRAKDDGTIVTTFDSTFNQSVETASSKHTYDYSIPTIADGYVHFEIHYRNSSDWDEDSESWLTYKVKADGISNLE